MVTISSRRVPMPWDHVRRVGIFGVRRGSSGFVLGFLRPLLFPFFPPQEAEEECKTVTVREITSKSDENVSRNLASNV